MHKSEHAGMEKMLQRYQGRKFVYVLDVGCRDVSLSFRPLVEGKGWTYVGLDLEDGENVDVVTGDPFRYPFVDGHFDVVLSGSTMEHITRPWLWIPELVRVLRPGGLLAIATVWNWPIHRHPVDCFRILPDGMQVLFDDTEQLERYEIDANDRDTFGSAFKREVVCSQ